jgi:hypothetical protein
MQRDARTMLVDAIASGERIESWTRTLSRALHEGASFALCAAF